MRTELTNRLSTNRTQTRRPASGAAMEPLEQRRMLSASISGTVYNDLNANGARDAGEPGVPNVYVYADVPNLGHFQNGDPVAKTKPDGQYTLVGAPAGIYAVRQGVPAHFRQTAPTGGAGQWVNVPNGAPTFTGRDFGDTQKVRLSGTAFNDANGDGALDNGEVALPNTLIYLDTNGSKTYTPGEPFTYSSNVGYWVLGNLPAGAYTVRAAKSGYVQTLPLSNGGYTKTLAAGTTADGLLFGLRLPPTVFFNAQSRSDSVTGGVNTVTHSAPSFVAFNDSLSYNDPSLFDGGTAVQHSTLSTAGIDANGSVSTTGTHDEGASSSSLDVTFTLTTAHAYSFNYTVDLAIAPTGDGGSVELKRLDNDTPIVPHTDIGGNPSLTHYAFAKNGTLAAGKYELIFFLAGNNSTVGDGGGSYSLHLGL